MQASNIGMIFEGITEAKRGNTFLGLQLFGSSMNVSHLPEAKAWYGYCLAVEKNAFAMGIALCHEARKLKPSSADIYLALGRIYLLAGRRGAAIKTFQQGLKLDNSREINSLLKSIGVRQPVVFRFLRRSNKINIFAGSLLSRTGLR
ncbi:MAG: hypothetical protein JW773_01850 [Desulfuromonadales bacterium]|nr:hypothetical protein [Desulfuromonadales bacterium]MBN2645029.1 hypothetical protein [Desulfuromonadaceae bacterium]